MTEIIKVTSTNLPLITDLITNLIGSSDIAEEQPDIDSIEKLLTDNRTHLFAATVDGSAVGYALAYSFPSLYVASSLAYLYDIEVLQIHRRKGIGKLLITAMLAHLKSAGVRELWLGTAVNNTEGQALFTATGAEKSGETFNDFTYSLS